ncbi:hypothetical protein FOL47_008569 [Perkinsus chesapeaki]|uniref:Uncharacterized protein n=1 Tax=Perkinsus chesapeaki TaxID=330153 RepID=A0A7J6LD85_PERCH|nr:hypothetical protein FOL47_008569 [Perkinsus chesapeaki]
MKNLVSGAIGIPVNEIESNYHGRKADDPSRIGLRQNVHRGIPSPEILHERVEKVVKTYLLLDEEARKSHGDDPSKEESRVHTLLGAYLWSSYTSLMTHIDAGCLTDNPLTPMDIKDHNGKLKCRRGTSSNECLHSVWKRSHSSITRLGPELFDARSLWKVSLTQLSRVKEALLIDGEPTIKFGSEYLQTIDSNALDQLLAECVSGESADFDCDGGQTDDNSLGDVEGFADFDSLTAADLDGQADTEENPNDLLAKVLSSPTRAKADKGTPEDVWREYNKRVFLEIDKALDHDTEILPLHRISQPDLRAYMAKLNNRQSTMATTSTGMEAVLRLMEELNQQEVRVPPARESTV